MNKKLVYIFVIATTLTALSCKKSGGTTPPPPPPVEENIAFSIEPDPGTSTVTSTTSTYPYTVKLTSKLLLSNFAKSDLFLFSIATIKSASFKLINLSKSKELPESMACAK